MISILMVCPHPTDATSFYRGYLPFGRLRQQLANVTLSFAPSIDWSVLAAVDVVFLQRPFTPNHRKIAEMAVEMKRPLWVDYDDYLLEVPADNPTHDTYSDPEGQANMKAILGMASVVTVSTAGLARKLALFNQNIHVVPNALDDELFQRGKFTPRNRLVVWRGSQTHQRDVAFYSDAILSVAQKQKDFTWHFQGWNPWFLTEAMPKGSCTVGAGLPMMAYMELMRKLSPAVLIVPLADNEFNRCKSNIAWIEGTYAGATILAPDWEEWQKPGVVTYRDPKDFELALNDLLAGACDLHAMNADSATYIGDHLLLSDVNGKRIEILRALVRRTEFAGWKIRGPEPRFAAELPF